MQTGAQVSNPQNSFGRYLPIENGNNRYFWLGLQQENLFRLTRPEYETPFHLLRRAWLIPLVEFE